MLAFHPPYNVLEFDYGTSNVCKVAKTPSGNKEMWHGKMCASCKQSTIRNRVLIQIHVCTRGVRGMIKIKLESGYTGRQCNLERLHNYVNYVALCKPGRSCKTGFSASVVHPQCRQFWWHTVHRRYPYTHLLWQRYRTLLQASLELERAARKWKTLLMWPINENGNL
jgi:hypothetical protein